MAHIIEVVRGTAGEARSFLDALFYSDSVSAIGHRPDRTGKTRAVAVNWDADEENELDERISQMIADALDAGKDEDVDAHCGLLPYISRNRPLPTRTYRLSINQIENQKFMTEIEIEINLDTGEMETTINGIAGPSCEKTAEAIKQIFGKPSRDEKTREYHVQPQIKRQIKGK